jgi:DNA mismatch repair protein MutS2
VQVGFGISQKALERLEWPEILARLGEFARTPRARARLLDAATDGSPGTSLFEATAAGVRERLAETAEANAILAEGDAPPIGGAAELAASLARARKGGALDAAQLLEVGSTLTAIRDTTRFLERRAEAAPRLAALGETIADQPVLRADIEGSLDPSGEVRDEASAALADARHEAHRLAGEIQGRLAHALRDPTIQSCLSDSYYTVRNDRYVLPVRADSRGGVRGIVHDASRSGTTLFVEPEALVELNNRHKRAELAIEQETRRVLRELTEGVADAADEIEAGLTALEIVDLAFARARFGQAQDAVEPEVRDEGVIRLPQLRHPLIPKDEAVANDLRLGEGFTVLVLSGPNAGGKTVTMKTVALAVLFTRAGLFVPAAGNARVDLFDTVLADIGDEQDIREHLSTFSAHMANLARIVREADGRSLVVLDEIGVGTDPGEGAAIAQAVLEALADAGARVVTTTHYNLLKEMAEVDERLANASVEFDPETLAPTYRLRMGLPGTSSASAVAARAPTSFCRARIAVSTACSRSCPRAARRSSTSSVRPAGCEPRRTRCAGSTGRSSRSSRPAATSSTGPCARTSTAPSETPTGRSPRSSATCSAAAPRSGRPRRARACSTSKPGPPTPRRKRVSRRRGLQTSSPSNGTASAPATRSSCKTEAPRPWWHSRTAAAAWRCASAALGSSFPWNALAPPRRRRPP